MLGSTKEERPEKLSTKEENPSAQAHGFLIVFNAQRLYGTKMLHAKISQCLRGKPPNHFDIL